MTLGPKHRKQSWIMLATLVALVTLLVGFGIYAARGEPDPVRGAAGPLAPNAPGKDPATAILRPHPSS